MVASTVLEVIHLGGIHFRVAAVTHAALEPLRRATRIPPTAPAHNLKHLLMNTSQEPWRHIAR